MSCLGFPGRLEQFSSHYRFAASWNLSPKVGLAKTGMGIWLFVASGLPLIPNNFSFWRMSSTRYAASKNLNDALSLAMKELDWRQERLALEIMQTAAQGEWEPDQIKLTALKRLVAEAVTRQLQAITK